jgi:ribosome modulation factor
MARLNITVPDMLYARLEQLRDRINLSKVCATALEKEVMMLEGQPNITDPRIARLLQRLQSTRERWHQRGYEDGINWAVELATRDELQNVATHFAEHKGQHLAKFFHVRDEMAFATHPAPPPPPMPPEPQTFYTHFQPPMQRGHIVSEPDFHPGMPPIKAMVAKADMAHKVMHHHVGGPFPDFPTSFHPEERLKYWQDQDREKNGEAAGETTRVEVDEGAYLEGWRDAVKGIWQAIAPALS